MENNKKQEEKLKHMELKLDGALASLPHMLQEAVLMNGWTPEKYDAVEVLFTNSMQHLYFT